MLEFQIPQISAEKVEENRGNFTIEPLDRGFAAPGPPAGPPRTLDDQREARERALLPGSAR